MDAQDDPLTCLVCKHELVSKVNMFKMRTTISKTLLSSKLSKIVQTSFSPKNLENHDICTLCVALLNHVDECECKLMALENEVKLKYKMPFAIEVGSSVGGPTPQPPPPSEEELLSAELHSGGRAEECTSVAAPQQASPDTGDGNLLDTGALVVSSTWRDTDGSLVIYRNPSKVSGINIDDQQLLGQGLSMPCLGALEASDTGAQNDNRALDFGRPDSGSKTSCQPNKKKKHHGKRKEGMSTSGAETGTESVTCHLCNEKLSNPKTLKSHLASHSYKKKMVCGFCPQVFPNNILLHRHWNREHPSDLQPCPRCDQRFLTKSSLKRHMVIHEERRFSCEQCGKLFHTQGDLTKHRLIKHSDMKKFQCSDCPLKFKLNWLLRRHRIYKHSEKESR